MTTAIRTDRHRPSAVEFDPQDYSLQGVFDLFPQGQGATRDETDRTRVVNSLVDAGFQFADHQQYGNCGHCGAHLIYAALLAHVDSRELIWVGETCLDNRFSRTKAEFDRLRKAAALSRAKQAKLAAYRALCDRHPALAYASYVEDIIDAYTSEDTNIVGRAGLGWALTTLVDINRKVRLYGDISDRQVAFLDRLWNEIDAKLAKLADVVDEPEAGPVPTGNGILVEGEVLGTKSVQGDFGWALKVIVKLDNGSRVYGTLPAQIESVEKGDRIRFVANVKASDDIDFGFASRPRKGEVVSRKEVAA